MDRSSPGSDIDLDLKGDQLNLDDLITAKAGLEELSLPYRIWIPLHPK